MGGGSSRLGRHPIGVAWRVSLDEVSYTPILSAVGRPSVRWGMATTTVVSSDTIPQPTDDVWSFVSNPANEPRWHTDILQVRPAHDPSGALPARWTLGSVWLVTVQFMGRRDYEVEITDVVPNERIEFTTKTGPMRPITRYLFEPSDGGTRFTRQVTMPLKGPMRALAPLLRRDLDKRNARFVQNLKGLLAT